MIPIILDTDIGDDIDDALALAMIFGLREIELRAITTVHAEVEIRARIAAKMLHTVDKGHTPVSVGHGQPFKQSPRWGWAQSEGQCLRGDERIDNIVSTSAVPFMKDKLLAEPGKILAIGPLTNVARLLTEHPEVSSRIDEIVIMGGLFNRAVAEYNIFMDPEAAQIVFHAGVPMRIIPFDVTETCLIESSLMEALSEERRPLQRLVWELIGYWQKQDGRTQPVLHDPLAVGCLVAPELYEFEAFDIEVDLTAERYGITTATPSPSSPLQVCTGVHYPKFHELFGASLLAEHAAERR